MTTETKIKLAELCGYEVHITEKGKLLIEVPLKNGHGKHWIEWNPATNAAQLMECVEAVKYRYEIQISSYKGIYNCQFLAPIECEANINVIDQEYETITEGEELTLHAAILSALTALVTENEE